MTRRITLSETGLTSQNVDKEYKKEATGPRVLLRLCMTMNLCVFVCVWWGGRSVGLPSRLQLVELFVYRDPTVVKGLLHPPVPIY